LGSGTLGNWEAKQKKLLDALGATPKSATKTPSKQSPSPPNPSNGHETDSPAAKGSNTPNKSPPNETNVESTNPSQADVDKTTPPVSEAAVTQQHRTGTEDSTAGSGDGGGQSMTDSAQDQPTVLPVTVEDGKTTLGKQSTQSGSTEHTNAGGRQPLIRKVRNTPPTKPQLSPHTGALDAGSIGQYATFNAKEQLGPWDVGYKVMEVDSNLQKLTRADELLIDVYGDTIHQNDGTHLDGGIADDKFWQGRWRQVVSCNLSLWDAPMGKVGKRFVQLLAEEWKGVRERRWNAEMPIVCCAAILNRKRNIIRASHL
jgi:hypothetical protein